MFELEIHFRPVVKLGVATGKARFEERHAAADVAADEVWINHTLGHEGRADRHSTARM